MSVYNVEAVFKMLGDLNNRIGRLEKLAEKAEKYLDKQNEYEDWVDDMKRAFGD